MTMTTASLLSRAHDGVVDEPDPAARPRRRTFTAEYKARILDEYDSLAHGSEERGALVRREGLYTSHIAEWRKVRDAGAREGLAPKSKAKRSPEQVELESLRRKNERLEAELARTKLALEITGKHTRAWSCSPRARTPTRSRSRDQRVLRGPRGGDVNEAGLRGAGRVTSDALSATTATGDPPEGASTDTTERAE